MVRYRIGQFLRAVWFRGVVLPPPAAAALLSAREMQLFRRMAPFDQAHSIALFQRLREIEPTRRDLHVAGLLHDVGKGMPSLTQRMAFVLVNAFRPGGTAGWDRIPRRNFRAGLVAMSHHADVGARFLEAAGSRRRVVEIVREQGNPKDVDAALLARIDGQC